MSKINAVRLININYNHNTYHISDETLHFNEQSTLIVLQNGGGKSVLVQLLIAPFVQKRYRNVNDRTFASYFTTSRPSFILVEWALENGAGYCLTGMMVRKSQNMDSNEDLELINFISEYKKACEQDINHLPVVENDKKEVRLKSFAACRAMFEEYKKEKLNEFFCYDMNNYAQSKQYFAKLAEYGIDYREWQNIIKKINEEESGLSKLFDECRDEKGLLEKWFLDAVENKLNKDKNRMQEFRSILEKYVASYSENYNKIQQQEKLTEFQQEAEPLLEQGTVYQKASAEVAASLAKIAAYLAELHRLAGINQEEVNTCQEELKVIKRQFMHLLHEEYSSSFYQAEAQKEALAAEREQASAKADSLEKQLAALQKQEHLLDCASLQARLDEDEQELKRAEQKVEVLRQKNKNLAPEREYIGFLLKQDTERKIKSVQERCRQSQREKYACLVREKQCKDALQQLSRRLNALHSEQGRLEGLLRTYDEAEQAHNKKWQGNLQRNILGEYEPGTLQILADSLANDMAATQQKQQQAQQKQLRGKDEIAKIERRLQDLEAAKQSKDKELFVKKQAKATIDGQLEQRRAWLQYVQLGENFIFDKQRLQKELERKLVELDTLKDNLHQKIVAVQKKYQRLQTGETLELSAEVEQLLERLGINLLYGMEWLKNNAYTEAENKRLVEQHPFLPYALIMSGREVEELRKAEKNIYTSIPVPIVLRESLKRDTKLVGENGVYQCGDVDFLMLFNDNLLNMEKFQQLLSTLQSEKQKLEQDSQQRKQEYDFYRGIYTELEQQQFTQASYNSLVEELAAMQEQLKQMEAQCRDAQAEKTQLVQEQEELATTLSALEKKLVWQSQQVEALQALTEKYQQYLLQLVQLQECQTNLADAERQQQNLGAELETLLKKLQLEMQYLAEFAAELKELEKELTQYVNYKQAPKPQNFSAELVQDIGALKARLEVIDKKLSGELKSLEESSARAAVRVKKDQNELMKKAARYGLQQEEWHGQHYSDAQMNEICSEQRNVQEEQKRVGEHLREVDKKLTVAEEKQKQVLARMDEECRMQQPVPKNELVQKNFVEAKSQLKQKEHQKLSQQEFFLERGRGYEENMAVLNEYAGISAKAEWDSSEKLAELSKEDLRSYTAKLRKNYTQSQKLEANAKEQLAQALLSLHNREVFQDEYYKKRIEVLQGLTGDAQAFMEQLRTVLQAFASLAEKLKADIALVEQEKEHIVTLLEDYIQAVHKQLGQIDRNSTIKIRGHYVKMLKLVLPEWNENANVYHTHVNDLVDEITQKGLVKLQKNEPINELIGKSLTTKELYNAVIGIANVHIQMFKVEAQREVPISWREVALNSGGEGFLSAFVILASLLYYMRRDDTDIFAERNEGKVLLMDNPFAQTNAAHLLTPLMDMAVKNNTQLISLTGLDGESIYNCYDNIYVLNLITSKLSNISYLKSKHIAGQEGDVLSLARVEVTNEGQMDSLF